MLVSVSWDTCFGHVQLPFKKIYLQQTLYINAYMWNLEKWYQWSYLQRRNRDTEVQIKHMDTPRGKEGGGMNWEIVIDTVDELCPGAELSRFGPVQLCATVWTVAHQAPLFMGFSRQEYWSGSPCPPGDLPHPGIEPCTADRFFTTWGIREALYYWPYV